MKDRRIEIVIKVTPKGDDDRVWLGAAEAKVSTDLIEDLLREPRYELEDRPEDDGIEFKDLIDFTPDNLRSIIADLLLDEIENISVVAQGKRLVVTDKETSETILILVTAAKIDERKEREHG